MGADLNPAALVRFLEQLGGCQCALGPQGVVVLLAEALDLLQSADDQADGCELSPGVRYLILVQ